MTFKVPEKLNEAAAKVRSGLGDLVVLVGRVSPETSQTKGVFLVSTKNAFVPVKRNHSMNTYSRISTVSLLS